MGYSTDFYGEFRVTPPLTSEHRQELVDFAETDHRDGSTPGIWCDWSPNAAGTAISWNGAEKFYDYDAWLNYLIKRFLAPKGYVLNGEVKWQGEDDGDVGKLCVTNNHLVVKPGTKTITY